MRAVSLLCERIAKPGKRITFNESEFIMSAVPQRQSSGTFADAKPLVVITGASGLIGSRVARALDGDYRIVGLDIKPPDDDATPMECIEADLTDHVSNAFFFTAKASVGGKVAARVEFACTAAAVE